MNICSWRLQFKWLGDLVQMASNMQENHSVTSCLRSQLHYAGLLSELCGFHTVVIFKVVAIPMERVSPLYYIAAKKTVVT